MEREIEGIEKVVTAMGRWAPSDLAYIERLEFVVADGEPASVTVVARFQRREGNAWPDIDRPMFRIRLLFEDVNGLSLHGFGGGCVQVMGFDIHSVADRQLESINFEVEDYEDGRLGFTCARIEILDVE